MANDIGSLPSTIKPANVTISSLHQNFISVSQNLTTFKTDRGGHRWKFQLDYPPMTREQYAEFWAFCVSARGRFNFFDYTLENHANLGQAQTSDQVTANETVLAGSRSIQCQNFTTSTSNVVKAGDFVKFGTSTKVHMITSSADSDSSGVATLNFEPAIQAQVAVDNPVSFDPVFQVSLVNDTFETAYGTNRLYGMTIELIEVLDV